MEWMTDAKTNFSNTGKDLCVRKLYHAGNTRGLGFDFVMLGKVEK